MIENKFLSVGTGEQVRQCGIQRHVLFRRAERTWTMWRVSYTCIQGMVKNKVY